MPKFRCKNSKKYSGIERKCKSLCMDAPSHSGARNTDTEEFDVVPKSLCKIIPKYRGIKRKYKSLCMATPSRSVSIYPFLSHGGTKNWRLRFFAMKLSIVYNILAFSVPRWAPTASGLLMIAATAGGLSSCRRSQTAGGPSADGQRPSQDRRNRRRRFQCCVRPPKAIAARRPEASPVAAGRRPPEARPQTASGSQTAAEGHCRHRRRLFHGRGTAGNDRIFRSVF